jgi:transglutaminase-like putative cysteine protease
LNIAKMTVESRATDGDNSRVELCAHCYRIEATVPPETRERMLSELADRGAKDPYVQTVARSLYGLLVARLGRAPTAVELVQWLMDQIHDLVDYVPDPDGEEIFQDVRYTLAGGSGYGTSSLSGSRRGGADCEDLATAVVSLGRVLGLRMYPKWWDQKGARLNHVAAQVCDGGTIRSEFGGCVSVETTIPGARVGETPYQALERVGNNFQNRVFG